METPCDRCEFEAVRHSANCSNSEEVLLSYYLRWNQLPDEYYGEHTEYSPAFPLNCPHEDGCPSSPLTKWTFFKTITFSTSFFGTSRFSPFWYIPFQYVRAQSAFSVGNIYRGGTYSLTLSRIGVPGLACLLPEFNGLSSMSADSIFFTVQPTQLTVSSRAAGGGAPPLCGPNAREA